jgi:NAD(P)-dependent dehydrogenase (short-subunit alcohol dehydrogenase family)
MQSLKNRVAVVTGGTRGIGRGVARELAQRGARVFVTGRTAPDSLDPDPDITGIRCDHRVDTQVEAAFEQVIGGAGGIDILVNNVWGGYERMVEGGEFTWGKPFWEQPLWRWDAMFAAGVRAHYHAARLAAPGMIARQHGLIVIVSHWAAQQRLGNGA